MWEFGDNRIGGRAGDLFSYILDMDWEEVREGSGVGGIYFSSLCNKPYAFTVGKI